MKKIIAIAYDLNPCIGSEAGAAYIWADILSKQFDTLIYTQEKHRHDLEKVNSKLTIEYISGKSIVSKLFLKLKLYNYDYSMFIKKVENRIGNEIIANDTILYFLTPAGIHSYNRLGSKLHIPYIIGPVGGFLELPSGFEEYRSITMAFKESFYKRLIKKTKWKEYFTGASKIIAGTGLVAKHLPEECSGKVRIIHDAVVDTDFFNSNNLKRKCYIVQIVYSGRLEQHKGCYILAKAFATLLQKGYENIRLVFAGDGKEFHKMNKFIEKNNIQSKARLVGWIPRNELKDLLVGSDIFCLPTLKEPGGTAILEAMACGIPVITTNYGGPASSVTKESGILIEPVSVHDYINKLSAALEMLINDQELRESMGAMARKHVIENFSSASLEKKIIDIFQEISSL